MAKGEALIRDLAKLFVKYRLSDWAVVIEVLRSGGPDYARIGQAIEQISSEHSRSRPPPKRAERGLAFGSSVDPGRAELLGTVYGDLARNTGPKLADLRDIYVRSGGKQTLPQKRQEIARALVLHLAQLADDTFLPTIKEMLADKRDFQGEYAKWFEMIYGQTRGSGVK